MTITGLSMPSFGLNLNFLKRQRREISYLSYIYISYIRYISFTYKLWETKATFSICYDPLNLNLMFQQINIYFLKMPHFFFSIFNESYLSIASITITFNFLVPITLAFPLIIDTLTVFMCTFGLISDPKSSRLLRSKSQHSQLSQSQFYIHAVHTIY